MVVGIVGLEQFLKLSYITQVYNSSQYNWPQDVHGSFYLL